MTTPIRPAKRTGPVGEYDEAVTVYVDEDERYPDFFVQEVHEQTHIGSFGAVIDVAPETLARWRRAIDTYNAVQDEIGSARDLAKGWPA